MFLTGNQTDEFIIKTFFPNLTPSVGPVTLPTDIIEQEDKYIVAVDIPGVDEKDIKIELLSDHLHISAERKLSVDSERWGGKGKVAVRVRDVDQEKISAKFKNGTLSVELPKAGKIRRTIAINSL